MSIFDILNFLYFTSTVVTVLTCFTIIYRFLYDSARNQKTLKIIYLVALIITYFTLTPAIILTILCASTILILFIGSTLHLQYVSTLQKYDDIQIINIIYLVLQGITSVFFELVNPIYSSICDKLKFDLSMLPNLLFNNKKSDVNMDNAFNNIFATLLNNKENKQDHQRVNKKHKNNITSNVATFKDILNTKKSNNDFKKIENMLTKLVDVSSITDDNTNSS